MKHLSNDHEDCPNQHEISHKLCNETGHCILHSTPCDNNYLQKNVSTFSKVYQETAIQNE